VPVRSLSKYRSVLKKCVGFVSEVRPNSRPDEACDFMDCSNRDKPLRSHFQEASASRWSRSGPASGDRSSAVSWRVVSGPELAVQQAKVDGFREVGVLNRLRRVQVGDGPRHAEDFVVCAGGQPKFLDAGLEQGQALLI
jgi:hypothetical protein